MANGRTRGIVCMGIERGGMVESWGCGLLRFVNGLNGYIACTYLFIEFVLQLYFFHTPLTISRLLMAASLCLDGLLMRMSRVVLLSSFV